MVGYTLSSQAGFSSYTANLPAKVENSGLEIDINSINVKTANFQWNTTFNITLPGNKLLAYPGVESSADAKSYEVGQSIRMVKGYKFTGVDPQTGLPTFLDVNKDGKLDNTNDYVVIGETLPTFFGGFGNQFTYKKLSLDIFFQFVKQDGPTINDGPSAGTYGSRVNWGVEALDYWRNPGDITSTPRAFYYIIKSRLSGFQKLLPLF